MTRAQRIETTTAAVHRHLPPDLAQTITTAPTWPHYADLIAQAPQLDETLAWLAAKVDLSPAGAAWVTAIRHDPAYWLYTNTSPDAA